MYEYLCEQCSRFFRYDFSYFSNNLVINESHDLFMTDYVIVLNMVFHISCGGRLKLFVSNIAVFLSNLFQVRIIKPTVMW